MAATLAGARLTERHRTQQVALKAVFLWEFHRIWPLLDPLRLDKTAAAWIEVALSLILGYRVQSTAISVEYYDRFRELETGVGLVDRGRVTAAVKPNDTAIRSSLIATGPAKLKHDTRRGVDIERAQTTALTATSGAASRHVLAGGRDGLVEAGRTERKPIRFFRVTDGNPCAFCAMLASRGPVYVTRETGLTTSASAPSRPPGEPYHDDCNCTVEPQFTRTQDWPGRGREFAKLWETSTKGYGGADALNAFRRAYEGSRRTGIPLQRA
jgi:hypothetical protein